MRALLAVTAASMLSIGIVAALAFDTGNHSDIPDNVRSWFKSVKSPHGVPCCDVSDGHHTTWRAAKDGSYEVPIKNPEDPDGSDHWYPVPSDAVVYDAGNPTGDAIVWYVRQGQNTYYIRCFVPGGGV